MKKKEYKTMVYYNSRFDWINYAILLQLLHQITLLKILKDKELSGRFISTNM